MQYVQNMYIFVYIYRKVYPRQDFEEPEKDSWGRRRVASAKVSEDKHLTTHGQEQFRAQDSRPGQLRLQDSAAESLRFPRQHVQER